MKLEEALDVQYSEAKAIVREFEEYLADIDVRPVFVGLGSTSNDFYITCGVPSAQMRERVPSLFKGLQVTSSTEPHPVVR